jgi:DNA processing protein
MDDEKIFQVSLSMIPGIGDVTAKTLLSYCGSAREIFKKSKQQLAKIPGIGLVNADKIKSFTRFSDAENEIEKCAQHHIEILFFADKRYPKKLKHAPDSPTVLYYKGNADLDNPKMVAIVGTRKSTSYGREFTEKLVEQLSAHKALIVSGLAYGIDINAHNAALKYGLDTVGVMASGQDVIYPSIHRGIAMQMLNQGGILTELKIGEKPEAHNFPARNRIIAGMCDVTIVIEAAEKGGALITAEIANSYNRDVFALPGDAGKRYSLGCNNLIKSHKAHLLTSVKDIEYIMNWDPQSISTTTEDKYYDFAKLSSEERVVIETLNGLSDGLVLDELSWKSQIPLNKLASILLNLEFSGIVKTIPGKKYKLI